MKFSSTIILIMNNIDDVSIDSVFIHARNLR